ncbi:hypothetical protein OG271_15070 [Micromonospora rifamycinica]|uniref:hypothetical protein n=1 Tax=Micromonospora rifamycinica TaxID=291594 RepID=UPI002E2C59F2|nr:hypothetical protein [Micromonospora rifamycinica]
MLDRPVPLPQQVGRRLRSLATLELVNIPLQAGIWFGWVGLPVTVPNLVGFGLVVLLLVQGSGYWTAKTYQLRDPAAILPAERVFRAARAANPVLLTVGLAITGYAVLTAPGSGAWPGLAFTIFAVLEHVNYFHVQLMYDTPADLRRLRSVGLRRSHLARDLRRAAALSARPRHPPHQPPGP